MFKRILAAAVITAGLAQPAHAFDHDSKVYRFLVYPAKKVLLLPVYLVGGGATGGALALVAWWHFGGREQDLKDALTGRGTR